MVEDGLVEEVRSLMEQYPTSLRAFQAIGYKELMESLKTTPLSDIINLIKQRTRNYAKRQYTYFNHQLPVNWFSSKGDALNFMEEYHAIK